MLEVNGCCPARRCASRRRSSEHVRALAGFMSCGKLQTGFTAGSISFAISRLLRLRTLDETDAENLSSE